MDKETIDKIKAELKLKFHKKMNKGNLSGAYAYMDAIGIIDVHINKNNNEKAS